MVCDYCSQIELKESFYSPKDYEETVGYVKELIEKYNYILVDGNCEIGAHKNKNGQWVADVIFHTVKCPECGQTFSCVVNAYRGGGSFKKD